MQFKFFKHTLYICLALRGGTGRRGSPERRRNTGELTRNIFWKLIKSRMMNCTPAFSTFISYWGWACWSYTKVNELFRAPSPNARPGKKFSSLPRNLPGVVPSLYWNFLRISENSRHMFLPCGGIFQEFPCPEFCTPPVRGTLFLDGLRNKRWALYKIFCYQTGSGMEDSI
jgi:hypothetical protein